MLCRKCQKDKPEDDFSWKSVPKQIRQTICRDCQRIVRRGWYERNRDHAIAYSKTTNAQIRDRNRQFLVDYLQSHPCLDCDESDPIVLEFDHCRGDKIAHVSHMASNGASLDRLQSEIDKCEVVCANCHRRRTSSRGGWFRSQ